MRTRLALPLFACLAGALLPFAGCGGDTVQTRPKQPTKTGTAKSEYSGGDDRGKCEYKNRPDREVSEAAGPGAIVPNIRRVYAIIGEGEDARKVISCREVDTDLDGMKDVIRTYDEKGLALREEADSDYDGKVDTWITFAGGRIAKSETDTNKDGQPDEARYYVRGALTRIQRDSNYDGKPDTFEIYNDGTLERMGVDLDHDGHVDRWDRDEVAVRRAYEKEREEEERREREEAKDGGVTDAYVSARNR